MKIIKVTHIGKSDGKSISQTYRVIDDLRYGSFVLDLETGEKLNGLFNGRRVSTVYMSSEEFNEMIEEMKHNSETDEHFIFVQEFDI